MRAAALLPLVLLGLAACGAPRPAEPAAELPIVVDEENPVDAPAPLLP